MTCPQPVVPAEYCRHNILCSPDTIRRYAAGIKSTVNPSDPGQPATNAAAVSEQPCLLNIVLFEPEIPPNTGNIIRLCANLPARLHLIGPLGFTLDDKRLRRAGLDHTDRSRVHQHDSLDQCVAAIGQARWLAFTTRAERCFSDWSYQAGDVLLFGPETRGLPESVLARFKPEQRLRIPQQPTSRSLNLSNAVAIAAYEGWRQLGYALPATRSRA